MGGKAGIIEYIVIEDEAGGGLKVPPLLPVQLLEQLGACMDLGQDRLRLKALQVDSKMTRLPSGHRTIRVDELNEAGLREAQEVLRGQAGLEVEQFIARKEGASGESWIGSSSSSLTPGGQSHELAEAAPEARREHDRGALEARG
eukprot:11179046-Lingulodinium_polyedra.AAC.1